MTEKPLYVRVAESVGWKCCEPHYGEWRGRLRATDAPRVLPRYDTDWAATGPLIDGYKISLFCAHRDYKEHAGLWAAGLWGHCGPRHGWYRHPLTAACHMILERRAASNL